MFETILVPLDGSPLSENALRPAFDLARLSKARVVLMRVPVFSELHVADSAASTYGVTYRANGHDAVVAQAQHYLDDILVARHGPSTPVTTHIGEGDVAAAIIATAEEENADLIMMSTHGYSGLTRFLLGSVTERVLAQAPCPVLAVRNDSVLRHVMVALDGSLLAEESLPLAARLVETVNGRLTLMHAVGQVDTLSMMSLEELEHGMGLQMQDAMYEEATAYLNSVRARFPGLNVTVTVDDGPAADVIMNTAAQANVDAIVMSTHGRTGLSRWMYGSVTARVLRTAHRSLLVIRP